MTKQLVLGFVALTAISISFLVDATPLVDPNGRRTRTTGNEYYDTCMNIEELLEDNLPRGYENNTFLHLRAMEARLKAATGNETVTMKGPPADPTLAGPGTSDDTTYTVRDQCRVIHISTVGDSPGEHTTIETDFKFDESACQYSYKHVQKLSALQPRKVETLTITFEYSFASRAGTFKTTLQSSNPDVDSVITSETVISRSDDKCWTETTKASGSANGQTQNYDAKSSVECKHQAPWFVCGVNQPVPGASGTASDAGVDDAGVDDAPAPDTARIFKINPIVSGGSGYNMKALTLNGVPNANDTYLVATPDLSAAQGGRLANSHLHIDMHDENSSYVGQEARADNSGSWPFVSTGNPDGVAVDPDHKVAQLMAFHYLNLQISEARKWGSWQASGRQITVRPHCYYAKSVDSLGLNAYFSSATNEICMSYSGPWEAAFDASVYAHEFGHANLYFATNGALNRFVSMFSANDEPCPANSPFGGNNTCCKSEKGCGRAIDEGQADVSSYFLFDRGSIGEYFTSDTIGFPERNMSGAAAKATTSFNWSRSRGEVHYLGAVYAAAWWDLYTAIGNDAKKLFYAHVPLLRASYDFTDALDQILVAAPKLGLDQRRGAILKAFANHGIYPNE